MATSSSPEKGLVKPPSHPSRCAQANENSPRNGKRKRARKLKAMRGDVNGSRTLDVDPQRSVGHDERPDWAEPSPPSRAGLRPVALPLATLAVAICPSSRRPIERLNEAPTVSVAPDESLLAQPAQSFARCVARRDAACVCQWSIGPGRAVEPRSLTDESAEGYRALLGQWARFEEARPEAQREAELYWSLRFKA